MKSGGMVVFHVLYVDGIILLGSVIGMLSTVNVQLAKTFDMKDLGEASYILGIMLHRDRKNRMIGLSQVAYIDKVLVRFAMQNFKKGITPFKHGLHLSKDQCPKTTEENKQMRAVPYASAVNSLMYVILCTRQDLCHAVSLISRYQQNPGPDHWTAVKYIIKYLRMTRDCMLIYGSDELTPIGYTDSNFMSNSDSRKSTSRYVFMLGGGAISWRSIKYECTADSTSEAENVAACEATKEAVWLKRFLMEFGVVLLA